MANKECKLCYLPVRQPGDQYCARCQRNMNRLKFLRETGAKMKKVNQASVHSDYMSEKTGVNMESEEQKKLDKKLRYFR